MGRRSSSLLARSRRSVHRHESTRQLAHRDRCHRRTGRSAVHCDPSLGPSCPQRSRRGRCGDHRRENHCAVAIRCPAARGGRSLEGRPPCPDRELVGELVDPRSSTPARVARPASSARMWLRPSRRQPSPSTRRRGCSSSHGTRMPRPAGRRISDSHNWRVTCSNGRGRRCRCRNGRLVTTLTSAVTGGRTNRGAIRVLLVVIVAVVIVGALSGSPKRPYRLDDPSPLGYAGLGRSLERLGASFSEIDAADVASTLRSRADTLFVPEAADGSEESTGDMAGIRRERRAGGARRPTVG